MPFPLIKYYAQAFTNRQVHSDKDELLNPKSRSREILMEGNMKAKTKGKAATENYHRKGMLGSGIHLYIVIRLGMSEEIGMFIWRMKIEKLVNFAKQVDLVEK